VLVPLLVLILWWTSCRLFLSLLDSVPYVLTDWLEYQFVCILWSDSLTIAIPEKIWIRFIRTQYLVDSAVKMIWKRTIILWDIIKHCSTLYFQGIIPIVIEMHKVLGVEIKMYSISYFILFMGLLGRYDRHPPSGSSKCRKLISPIDDHPSGRHRLYKDTASRQHLEFVPNQPHYIYYTISNAVRIISIIFLSFRTKIFILGFPNFRWQVLTS
jgi:hypothetical protein